MPVKKFLTAGADLLAEFYDKTPTERLRTASERATYDPEDGGLGLAPGNTSEERMQLMFPTRVFHGGEGTAVQHEIPQTYQKNAPGATYDTFVSDHPQVASSYTPAAPRDRKPQTQGLQDVPDFSGNVMPLRLDDSDALVADYEGRLFSGFSVSEGTGPLNDVTLRSTDGTPLIRLRKEMKEPHGVTVSRGYLPGYEQPFDPLNPVDAFGTEVTHYKGLHEVKNNYGFTPSMTRFDNIIDIGRHRHGEKSSERFIPSTVYAIRDGSKVRSDFAAFDPLLRKYSGLSLGASAAAFGSLLDQLPPDEAKQGALYAEGER